LSTCNLLRSQASESRRAEYVSKRRANNPREDPGASWQEAAGGFGTVDEMLKENQDLRSRENVRPIWEIIEEISREAPPGTWDDVPTDGSVNHDHYLYGAPKQEP